MKPMLLAAGLVLILACGAEPRANDPPDAASAPFILDSTSVRWSVDGLAGPEAVRWDPDARVWFVANFGPPADSERDGNGFISRLDADGRLDSLRFMTGTPDAPLHMPRGMFIRGDTLWVADVDGVHAFDRRGGGHLAFVDFRAHEPGFLNDIAAAPGGPLHVTDTGSRRVYRIPGMGAEPEIVIDSLPDGPNGITWSDAHAAFLLAPWDEGRLIRSLTPAGVVDSVIVLEGGRFDGIEMVRQGFLVASQADSSLWLVEGDSARRVVRTRGRPADIAFDPERRLVAVPYISLNRVDVWQLR